MELRVVLRNQFTAIVRASHRRETDKQLSYRMTDRATRYVSRNLANCCTTVRKLAIGERLLKVI